MTEEKNIPDNQVKQSDEPISVGKLPTHERLVEIMAAQDLYFETYAIPIILTSKTQEKVSQSHPE